MNGPTGHEVMGFECFRTEKRNSKGFAWKWNRRPSYFFFIAVFFYFFHCMPCHALQENAPSLGCIRMSFCGWRKIKTKIPHKNTVPGVCSSWEFGLLCCHKNYGNGKWNIQNQNCVRRTKRRKDEKTKNEKCTSSHGIPHQESIRWRKSISEFRIRNQEPGTFQTQKSIWIEVTEPVLVLRKKSQKFLQPLVNVTVEEEVDLNATLLLHTSLYSLCTVIGRLFSHRYRSYTSCRS